MLKRLLTLSIILIGVLGMNAQTISGTVTDYNGTAIANHAVAIMNTDSMSPYYSTTNTNASGAYSFTGLPTNSYVVSTLDCQNQNHTVAVATNSGTADFSICSSNPTSCTAVFIASPDSNNNPNLINFTDLSTGNPTSWAWDFGDGTTSSLQNPNHTYAANGTYNVTLSITSASCSDSVSHDVVIGVTTTTYTISGTVMAGSNIVSNAIVSLFNVTSNAYVSNTNVTPNGAYTFANVTTGSYKVLATIVDSTGTTTQSYAPTYYGDVLFWSTASVVSVNSNQNLGAINLIALPTVPGGNGSISGNIGTGSKAASEDVIVNLLDNTLNLLATTKTDANGDYNFTNLAYNTYKIWVEIAGKVTTPISVTLDANNSSSDNNDFIERNGTVTPKATSIANSISKNDINIYPNPVQNILNVELDVINTGVYTFNIFSITGQMISAEQINVTSGNNLIKLNTNSLNSGSYILIITNDTNTSIQKLFTK